MLEQPECISLAAQLTTCCVGKQVRAVQAGLAPHKFAFFAEDPAGYPALLVGRTLQKAVAIGPYVELHLEDNHLLFRDGVNLRYSTPGTPPPKKHQLLVEFTDGSFLTSSVQMYGLLFAYPAGTLENIYYDAAVNTPSALDEAFTEDYFLQMCRGVKPTLSAKALLATEQRIPGLGNGVLQDILLLSHLHPKRKLQDLNETQRRALWQNIRTLMQKMAQEGGRDTEKDLYGQSGGYRTLLSAKTWQQPCPVCGGPMQKQAYLGGSVYFCSNCQPL